MTSTVYSRENLRNPVGGGEVFPKYLKTQDCKAAEDEPAAMLIRVFMNLIADQR